MFSRTRVPWRRKTSAQGTPKSATEALAYLNPELRATLASLHGAPHSVAEAAIQLLSFGSRAGIETMNPPIAVACEPIDGEGYRPLKLTAFAYEVMAAAAAEAGADPEKAAELDADARQALLDIAERSVKRGR